MQLDKAAIDRLLALDDAGLRAMIAALAAGAGLAPGQAALSDRDLAALRQTLGTNSPEALARMVAQMTAERGSSHGK